MPKSFVLGGKIKFFFYNNSRIHFEKTNLNYNEMENKYLEFKKEVEQKINDFPQFWAFSKEQFNEGLKELNVSENEILSTGSGGFIRKSDREKYIQMWEEINSKEDELLKDDEFLYLAFRYELGNHEYSYTYDFTQTLDCFNLKYEDLTKRQLRILNKAKKDYLKGCE